NKRKRIQAGFCRFSRLRDLSCAISVPHRPAYIRPRMSSGLPAASDSAIRSLRGLTLPPGMPFGLRSIWVVVSKSPFFKDEGVACAVLTARFPPG
ncbi:hypothetical protein, partial [Gluconobacter japonicus]|uniref:hypothetical protein n=1 Tax=Gluconobacter japonicus TaxID=376620 RepID=UPI002232B02F